MSKSKEKLIMNITVQLTPKYSITFNNCAMSWNDTDLKIYCTIDGKEHVRGLFKRADIHCGVLVDYERGYC